MTCGMDTTDNTMQQLPQGEIERLKLTFAARDNGKIYALTFCKNVRRESERPCSPTHSSGHA